MIEIKYISTRGEAPAISFREAVLTGLAADGGLYVPDAWPSLSADRVYDFRGRPFADVAAEIMALFAGGELSSETLATIAGDAYATFDDPIVAAPLSPLVSPPVSPPVSPLGPFDPAGSATGGDLYLLELFHGPTLAFKDVAMQLLARLYEWALDAGSGEDDGARGSKRRKTIIGATSGDTGGAAVDAFAGRADVDVFMLHPAGRISDVQRRIMTTNGAPNVVNIAVDGSFDDCQRIVKALFADEALNAARDLGGVNSINWVRLAAQTVYYATALAEIGGPASFVVPTGNFGDAFAGFAAKRMGLPVNRIAVAVNENDIMHRALSTGAYRPQSVSATTSPSMDIQVASNFERLLFEAAGRNAAVVRDLMAQFSRDQGMTVPPSLLSSIREDFVSERADENEVAAKIRDVRERSGKLVDPHTAVGLVVADKLIAQGALSGPVVVLATAHPAKFPDAVEAAAGVRPPLPARFADLFERAETLLRAPAEADAVARLILDGGTAPSTESRGGRSAA